MWAVYYLYYFVIDYIPGRARVSSSADLLGMNNLRYTSQASKGVLQLELFFTDDHIALVDLNTSEWWQELLRVMYLSVQKQKITEGCSILNTQLNMA